jgi:hypothetical protein
MTLCVKGRGRAPRRETARLIDILACGGTLTGRGGEGLTPALETVTRRQPALRVPDRRSITMLATLYAIPLSYRSQRLHPASTAAFDAPEK